MVAGQPGHARGGTPPGEQQPFLIGRLAQHLGAHVTDQRPQLAGGPSTHGERGQRVAGADRHLGQQHGVLIGQGDRQPAGCRSGCPQQPVRGVLAHGCHLLAPFVIVTPPLGVSVNYYKKGS